MFFLLSSLPSLLSKQTWLNNDSAVCWLFTIFCVVVVLVLVVWFVIVAVLFVCSFHIQSPWLHSTPLWFLFKVVRQLFFCIRLSVRPSVRLSVFGHVYLWQQQQNIIRFPFSSLPYVVINGDLQVLALLLLFFFWVLFLHFVLIRIFFLSNSMLINY